MSCLDNFATAGLIIPSVIAVHGLGSNYPQTWTQDDKMWLKDFLSSDFRYARVLAFVYPPEASADDGLRAPAISLLRAIVNERADMYLKVRRCLLYSCRIANESATVAHPPHNLRWS